MPSENALLEALSASGRPMSFDELAAEFGLGAKQHREALRRRLSEMTRAGQILCNRGGEYCLVERLHLVTGPVSAHRDGFGFVLPDDESDDVYLSAREMRPLFHGDRVAVRVAGTDSRGRREGHVVEILERRTDEVAGQLIRERGISLLIPDNPRIIHRILIPGRMRGGARPGQMVVARIVDYPTAVEQATGEVVSVLGEPGERGMATELAIHAHGIPHQWPRPVAAAAAGFGTTVATAAKKGRLDLRSTALVTIDGEDARDFDDAVYCESTATGWRLVVAIADVAHYVEPDSPLDDEATRRGTSVYFPDRVVPMLPEALSNGLCSLNPRVDRLCLVCEMQVSRNGKVTRSRFHEGVMRSSARLTYSEVARFFETGTADTRVLRPASVRENLTSLLDLYRAFAKARRQRGALELDIPQLRILLDRDGEIAAIRAYERNDAHRLIEECMIAANVEAARFLAKHRIAGLYRVHARPKPDRFDEFRQYLLTLGLEVPLVEHVRPKDFKRLLDAVAGRPDSHAISMALLRSMPHAEYTPDNVGHFGLALAEYAHFTSPIRRYPDLLVHRAIKHVLGGGKARAYRYARDQMAALGRITSAHERRAEDATREVEAWLKCVFMQDKVGKTFDGIVSSVTAFGLFVLLPEFQVDGLVHVSNLRNDYYEYEPQRQRLVGSRTGKGYGLGDRLRVVVHDVDMDNRRIDFRLAR